jgi:hypothetical protein
MTTSPASRAVFPSASRILAGLVLATGVVASARAQVAQPVAAPPEPLQLSPSARGEPVQLAPPTTLLPRDGGAAATGAAGAGPADPTDPDVTPNVEGIEISRLTELDPESVGILDPNHGGFPANLWRGTERRTVERLLPHLPGALGSTTMRDLARRLLLTNAAPPVVRAGQASDRGTNLLALRVGRLAAMGDFEGLSGLLEVAPQRYDTEAVARARVETLFLDARSDDACKEVRVKVAEQDSPVYWRKALVYCQILQKDADGANLGLALLREQGETDADPVFFALADNLLGLQDLDPALSPATALHLAMYQSTGRPLPVEAIDQASPGLLVLLARTSANSLEQRTKAAERALSLGLLKPAEVGQLYLEYPFDADQRANAISTAGQLSGAERRALLYQAASAQDVPAVRAEILNVALTTGDEDGSYGLRARVFEDLVAGIPLQPELAWFAGTAGRVLYAAGRFEQAGAWLNLARQESLMNTQAATAVTSLWPYSRLAGARASTWQGDLSTWAEAQVRLTPEEVAERQLLLRTIFKALGQSDPLVWTDLVGAQGADQLAGLQPDPALLYALSEASQLDKLGETVLLALLALGEDGPGGAHPLVLEEVLAALMRVNLTHEARMLAIEAAVANGV